MIIDIKHKWSAKKGLSLTSAINDSAHLSHLSSGPGSEDFSSYSWDK